MPSTGKHASSEKRGKPKAAPRGTEYQAREMRVSEVALRLVFVA